jgi:uncharacterized protein (TIGR00251 family)
MVMPVWLAANAKGGSELTLHVQPGAAKSELAGVHGDALKVRIAARAIDGAANAAVLAFVADWLALPRRDVRLLRGEKSRSKTLWVPLDSRAVAARAAGL